MPNPYLPPTAPSDSLLPHGTGLTRSTVAFVLASAVAGGLLLGAFTNLVNGYVSPDYFRGVMGWQTPYIWAAAIGQGAIEGAVYAVIYTLLIIGLAKLLSRTPLVTSTLLRLQFTTFLIVLILWLIGGSAAVAFARYFPYKCSPQYFGHSYWWPDIAFYAWVRGSIWGAVYGAPVAMCISFFLRRRLLFGPKAC